MSVSLVRECEIPECPNEGRKLVLVRLDVIAEDPYGGGIATVSVAGYALCDHCASLVLVMGECHAYGTLTEFRRMESESLRMSMAAMN